MPKRNNKKTGERVIKSPKKGLFIFKQALLFIIIFSLGATATYLYQQQKQNQEQENQQEDLVQIEKDIYIRFIIEVYDKIQENYWEKVSDEILSKLFKLGAENLTQKPQVLETKDKKGVTTMLKEAMQEMPELEKREFSIQLTDLVLKNLSPYGRSQLYSSKSAAELAKRVKNIDPETQEVKPTVFSKLLRPEIFYVQIKKFSPQTLEEFNKAAEKVDQGKDLDTLILDLRANIGGSIDLLPYFLGPFIGNNQYAYEFLHQEEHTPFKTKIGWLPSLVRYKKVVILIDEMTQSSGEVVAATLKKYNVGVLVGRRTRGWGTVEKVFELEQQIDANEKYSVFLAHSLTIRDDGQLIEGNGVEPVISIDSPDWEDQLFAYFRYNQLIQTVKEIWGNPPVPLP